MDISTIGTKVQRFNDIIAQNIINKLKITICAHL
jgi:hypothetical protein